MKTIPVKARLPYTVYIGENILKEIPLLIEDYPKKKFRKGTLVFIVSDKNVSRLYMKSVTRPLKKNGFRVRNAVLSGGEKRKNHGSLYKLYRFMVRHGLTRDSLVIALGGGVIGDLAGYAASTYMRGCSLVQVPTSLLAQVDSSIGGKVGINMKEGKNLIGSFFHPLFVVSDVDTLKSLPPREFVSGLSEIIKSGLIFNETLFSLIRSLVKNQKDKGETLSDSEVKKLFLSERDLLYDIIVKSVKIKADIVGSDERENDLRMILNFGHTFGHALESATRYKRFLHGEAVLFGMKIASDLSCALGMIDASKREAIFELVDMFRLPSVKGISARSLLSLIERDKKKRDGKVHYVLLKDIGYAITQTDIDKRMILASIDKILSLHRKA